MARTYLEWGTPCAQTTVYPSRRLKAIRELGINPNKNKPTYDALSKRFPLNFFNAYANGMDNRGRIQIIYLEGIESQPCHVPSNPVPRYQTAKFTVANEVVKLLFLRSGINPRNERINIGL